MHKQHWPSKIVLIILLFLSFQSIKAQENSPSHDHEGHEHGSEIGLSLAPVYFFDQKEFSFGIHTHYTYNFPGTKFGLGVAYEHIFDDHKHNFVGVEAAFRPIHPLSVSITPGMNYEGNHFNQGEFAIHIETGYEFELGSFHVGPVVEFAWHSEGYHASLGLHLGKEF